MIKEADPSCWPAVWPFWQRIVRAGAAFAFDEDATYEVARELWMPRGARVFVAEESGAVVGSAYLRANYGGPARRIANAGFMVDPAYAGRGIGRELAEHVMERAEQAGFEGMVFNSVVATNPAMGLWRSLGFAVVGTIPAAFHHPEHGPTDLLILHRRL
ncbi:GNAT family N-acetyltransferase [Streptomyces sp. NPDC050658]|uniref:GNAT family N-acetyltransferase n=1 Tax=unclassified Streptomyces TaxID=2593676 RepID=UPI0034434A74